MFSAVWRGLGQAGHAGPSECFESFSLHAPACLAGLLAASMRPLAIAAAWLHPAAALVAHRALMVGNCGAVGRALLAGPVCLGSAVTHIRQGLEAVVAGLKLLKLAVGAGPGSPCCRSRRAVEQARPGCWDHHQAAAPLALLSSFSRLVIASRGAATSAGLSGAWNGARIDQTASSPAKGPGLADNSWLLGWASDRAASHSAPAFWRASPRPPSPQPFRAQQPRRFSRSAHMHIQSPAENARRGHDVRAGSTRVTLTQGSVAWSSCAAASR